MKQVHTLAFMGVLGLSTILAADDASDAKPFVGRWNIQIQGTGDTFQTAWLKLTASDGKLGGALVWKWGSVVPIKNVTVKAEELRFTRGKSSFSVKLAGDKLLGVAKMEKGKEFKFVGRRATEMTEVTGTWKVGMAERPDDPRATLVFERKNGKISGKAIDPEGNDFAIRDAAIDGYALSFKAFPKGLDGTPREVSCEIRGDRLVGKVEVTLPGETEKRTLPIEGKRRRAWGEPVKLLEKNGLDGWGPRDPKRKFGWKVTEGVLENSPPDVDIVSAAKFRDFRLELEYKVDPRSNSGIYLRGRYELQILGDTRIQNHGNMAVYSRLSPKKNPIKLGEWNALDVTFIGRWLTVVLNGETVYDNQYLEGTTGGAWDEKEEEPGSVLLQGDHGKVRFRNIVVTPVK